MNHIIGGNFNKLITAIVPGSEGVIVVATLYIVFCLPEYPGACDRTTRTATAATATSGAGQGGRPQRCPSVAFLLREFSSAITVTFRKRAAGVRLLVVLLLVSDFFIAVVFSGKYPPGQDWHLVWLVKQTQTIR